MDAEADKPERITLTALALLPLWVAWQTELRPKGKKPTKVPYRPGGRSRAMADKPETWGTRVEAEARALTLPKPYGTGGVGLEFGQLSNGRHLSGIDLDTCRDRETGVIAGWAQAIIDRLETYTEVSPSGTGVKLFCLHAQADRDRLRRALGMTATGGWKHGATWSQKSEAGHPPAIEVHLSNRYFAVTDQILDGCTDELREIPSTELLQVIELDGPAFVRGEVAATNSATQKTPDDRPETCRAGGQDQSRSVRAFKIGAEVRRTGGNFEAMCEAIRTNSDTAEWYAEKGEVDDRRELRRIWDKTDPFAGDLVLFAGSPLNSAKQFIGRHHMLHGPAWSGGLRTLHHQNATFYSWNRSHYVEITPEVMRSGLYGFLDGAETINGSQQLVAFNPTKNKVANVLEATASEAQLCGIHSPVWLDDVPRPAASELIACGNGLLHLPTRVLHPHTPAFFTLNALPFDFAPEALVPARWLTFLGSIWANDVQAIAALQEMFGLMLTADTSHQKAFLIVGPKRSGKGTIARVLTELLGGANVCSPTLGSLSTNFGLAPLIGKRLAIISDARLSGKSDQAVIAERLLAITGEDAQTVDRKYREAWTGKLDTRFLILTNELPRLSDSSGALASRFVILTMTRSFFGEEDRGLGQKLLRELPGILNWAIEGWDRLTRRGYFIPPASSADAIREMEDLGSPIGAFLRDCCIVGDGGSCKSTTLYAAWRHWCQVHGREHPGNAQTFGRDLAAAFSGLKLTQHRAEDGTRDRYYEGVKLSNEPTLARSDTRDEPLCSVPPSYHPDDPGPTPY